MAKVTNKLQVTIPKALAEQYGIKPGDEIDWEPAGQAIRIVPTRLRRARMSPAERLKRFDQAVGRQQERQKANPSQVAEPSDRGWSREDLYIRGGSG